jgi:hypothetical protein
LGKFNLSEPISFSFLFFFFSEPISSSIKCLLQKQPHSVCCMKPHTYKGCRIAPIVEPHDLQE